MRSKLRKKGYEIVNYGHDMFGNVEYNHDLEFIYRRVNFFNKAQRGLWIDQVRINKLIDMYEFKGNRNNK